MVFSTKFWIILIACAIFAVFLLIRFGKWANANAEEYQKAQDEKLKLLEKEISDSGFTPVNAYHFSDIDFLVDPALEQIIIGDLKSMTFKTIAFADIQGGGPQMEYDDYVTNDFNDGTVIPYNYSICIGLKGGSEIIPLLSGVTSSTSAIGLKAMDFAKHVSAILRIVVKENKKNNFWNK